jgi:hypothetical protein
MCHIIASGRIKKTGTPSGKEVPCDFIFLDKTRLADIMNLQDLIVQELDDPELFHPGTIQFIEEHIQKRGRIIAAFSGDILIAYRVLSFPGTNHDNLGIDLGLPKNELQRVAHLEFFVVHPDFRGNALQMKTLPLTIRILHDLGYEHLCATVSPKNYPGVSNLLKGGFVIKELKEKYKGKLRYILYQNLNTPIINDIEHAITVTNTDIEGQKIALMQGYYGYKARKKTGCFAIDYGK